MKVNQNILDKSLNEVTDMLANPEKQKGLTLGERVQLIGLVERAASAQAKLQNPQKIPSEVELALKQLEKRIKTVEDKLDAICEAFSGN